MRKVYSAPEAIHFIQNAGGLKLETWKLGRAFLASKKCKQCGKTFFPWVVVEDGKILHVFKEKLWEKQECCGQSCAKKLKNPMLSEISKEKMKYTLKKIGHRPKIRGGNGCLTIPQISLISILSKEWETEVAIPTKEPKSEHIYPTCYKVDIGNRKMKIAIELDGKSHTGKMKEKDMKKDKKLTELGWLVYRLKNEQAMSLFTTYRYQGLPHITLMEFLSTTATLYHENQKPDT